MVNESAELLQCYNRGCGQKYNQNENKENSCCHHPGMPVFHDAYKGWSCCSKKCTDFTEFLNIKGCTLSFHSNEKLPEPEKPKQEILEDEVIEVKPIVPSSMKRPSFETPLVPIPPEIAPSLKQQLAQQQNENVSVTNDKNSFETAIGTPCKNGGCSVPYSGPETDLSLCIYHPGVPIFHEGLKFWSCCQKRTTDFTAFLNQVGCEEGKHLWKKQDNENVIKCRWDHHQTASHVVVSIYAKQYCIDKSWVKLNPIRLCAHLFFPQNDAAFELDIELRGIIEVSNSKVSMFGTKVEIKLKKAEPGSWPKLEIPRSVPKIDQQNDKINTTVEEITPSIEGVDLSDLQS